MSIKHPDQYRFLILKVIFLKLSKILNQNLNVSVTLTMEFLTGNLVLATNIVQQPVMLLPQVT